MVVFTVWIVFIHLEQKNKLQSDKRLCKNKDFYGVLMPSEVTKILEFNQYKTSDKPPSIIYANLESLIENRWV